MLTAFIFLLFATSVVLFLSRLVIYWTHCSDAIEGISELQDRQNAEWLYQVYFPKGCTNPLMIFDFRKWTFEDFFPGLARHIF